jgi:uncharacterized damage-inducible protein DinB
MSTYQRALDIMVATPTVLRALVESTPPEAIERRPSDEAWSAREILVHMLFVETAVISERVRLMLAEENPLFGAVSPQSAPDDPKEILDEWQRSRERNLEFLRTLTPAQLERTGRHPKYGQISVREHVVEWAYHDLDHVRQILATIQAETYPDIGVFQALYPKPT